MSARRRASSSIGRVFGRLLVLDVAQASKHRPVAVCVCLCGKQGHLTKLTSLVQGNTTSCGCVRSENATHLIAGNRQTGSKHGRYKHGMSKSSEFRIWAGMLQRCRNPSCDRYEDYGGRGISVDPRWLEFQAFYADMGPRPTRQTLERIDNNKGYGPDNCVWATYEEQSYNKRDNKRFEVLGKQMTLAEIAKITGVPLEVFIAEHKKKKRFHETLLSVVGYPTFAELVLR